MPTAQQITANAIDDLTVLYHHDLSDDAPVPTYQGSLAPEFVFLLFAVEDRLCCRFTSSEIDTIRRNRDFYALIEARMPQ
jgi:hypothetical protein